MIDVIIPLGIGSKWENNELRYCLRSLETNFLDLGIIYLVGHKPDWVKDIVHIESEDTFLHNKDANIIKKTLLICERRSVSDYIMRISDDQLLLQPMFSREIKPLYQLELNESYFQKMNRWRRRLKNSFEVLKKDKIEKIYNYETHIPVIYDRRRFIDTYTKYKDWAIDGAGYTINTMYFNNIKCDKVKLTNEKACFEQPVQTVEEIIKMLKNKLYLGYNDNGLNDNLKQVIKELFPKKSKFEKF